jgi:hypothetical protein
VFDDDPDPNSSDGSDDGWGLGDLWGSFWGDVTNFFGGFFGGGDDPGDAQTDVVPPSGPPSGTDPEFPSLQPPPQQWDNNSPAPLDGAGDPSGNTSNTDPLSQDTPPSQLNDRATGDNAPDPYQQVLDQYKENSDQIPPPLSDEDYEKMLPNRPGSDDSPTFRPDNGGVKSPGQEEADFAREQAEGEAELAKWLAEKGLDKAIDKGEEAVLVYAMADSLGKELAEQLAKGITWGLGIEWSLLESTETAGPELDERPSTSGPFAGSRYHSERLP